ARLHRRRPHGAGRPRAGRRPARDRGAPGGPHGRGRPPAGGHGGRGAPGPLPRPPVPLSRPPRSRPRPPGPAGGGSTDRGGGVLAQRDQLGEIVRIEGAVCTEAADEAGPRERREILLGEVPHFVALFRALCGPISAMTWHIDGLTTDDLALVTHAGLTQISLF